MNIKKMIKNFAQRNGYKIGDADYHPTVTDRKVYDYYLNNDRPVRTIFDVGANIGQTAIPFSKAFPDATIYSFEPFEKTFCRLVNATRHLPNVRPFPIGLGDAEARLEVASEPAEKDYDLNSLLPEKQADLAARANVEKQFVTIQTGQEFCLQNAVESIDILKIDTEGYELPVLNGFGKMLENAVQCVLCEFCLMPNKDRQTPLCSLSETLGVAGFRLVSFYDIRHEADGAFHYGNALFVHIDRLRSEQRW